MKLFALFCRRGSEAQTPEGLAQGVKALVSGCKALCCELTTFILHHRWLVGSSGPPPEAPGVYRSG